VDNERGAGSIEVMDWRYAPPEPPMRIDDDRDHVVVLPNVTWDMYEALLARRGERPMPRYAYLDGELEVITTSMRHELAKKLIARLLETYALVRRVALTGAGNTTFRRKAKKAGLEPDECYFIGKGRKTPQIAIEITLTSGGLPKLQIYRRLGVQEVWFWLEGRFWLYALVDGEYEEIRASRAIPGFDFDEITRIILTTEDDDDQTDVVREYHESLIRRSQT
jgi:Uma2 family endonuclease